MATTRKKVKIIGHETYINQSTGEVKEMQVVSVETRDANFHKLWLEHIIYSLNIIGNQKIRFAFWLLDHMNKENQITMTLRQMSEKSKISLETVRITVKALVEADFLKKYNIGVYQVNPEIIFKGGKTDRLNVLYQYQNINEDAEEDVIDVAEENSKAPVVNDGDTK